MKDKILGKLLGKYNKKSELPDHYIDPAKKDEMFGVMIGDWLLYNYINNNSLIPYSYGQDRYSIAQLREFAVGYEPIAQYQDIVCPKESRFFGQDSGFINIDWDTVKIMPIFRDVIKAMLSDVEFDVQPYAVDPQSKYDRETEIAYQKLMLMPQMQELNAVLAERGIPLKEAQFQTEQQIELAAKLGGFKLASEIEAKKCLVKSFTDSRYDGIRDKIIEDVIDIGVVTTQTYIDEVEKTPKVRYVNPDLFVGVYDNYKDGRNMYIAGELRPMTVRELRHQTNATEEQIAELVAMYGQQDFYGYTVETQRSTQYRSLYKTSVVDDWKLWVLDFRFITTDVEKLAVATRRSTGNIKVRPVPFDIKLTDKEIQKGVEIEEIKTEHEYGGMLVLGTNIMLNWGKKETIRVGKKGQKRAILSYSFYDTQTPSIVERCIPHIKEINLNTYKLRDMAAKLPPPPWMSVDDGLMENISFGNIKMSKQQVFDLFGQTGYFLIRSKGDFDDNVSSNNINPITPIQLNIEQPYNFYTGNIARNVDMIRLVTGVNEVVDASTPPSKRGYGVSMLAYEGAKNTMKPMARALESNYEDTANQLFLKWMSLANNDIKEPFDSVGNNTYEIIKLASKQGRVLDLNLETLPTRDEREKMIAKVDELEIAFITSGVGLDAGTGIQVRELIAKGQIYLARIIMSNAIQQARQQMMEQQQMADEANTQRQIQSNQAATAAKYEMDSNLAQLDMVKDNNKSNNTRSEMILKGQIDALLMGKEFEFENLLKQQDKNENVNIKSATKI